MVCGRCGGVNTTDAPCPECGCLPFSSAGGDKLDISGFGGKLDDLDTLRIPKAYFGKRWNKDTFWSAHDGQSKNRLVVRFVDQMEKVHNLFAGSGLPDKSAVFAAPAGYGKMVWAYSCMQYALANGFTVAPMLDTLEIKRLFVLSAERPKSKVLTVDYDEYIGADVLFFTVTKTEYRKNAADIIADLVDKRARRGKGTFGISRVTLSEMSQWDTTNAFRAWNEPVNPVDGLKNPVYISCL